MPQTSWSYCSRDSQLTINISALSQPSVGQVSRSYMDDTYPIVPRKQWYYQKTKKEYFKVKHKWPNMCWFGNELYKWSFIKPYLRWLTPIQAKIVLSWGHLWKSCKRKIIFSSGHHSRLLLTYLETKCWSIRLEVWQVLAIPINNLWSFSLWKVGMVRPLRTTPSEKKFLLVATDYFTNR